MNRLIIGVSFDANFQSRLGKHFGNSLDFFCGSGQELGLTAIEEAKFFEADREALGRYLKDHFVILELLPHRQLELSPQLKHVLNRSG